MTSNTLAQSPSKKDRSNLAYANALRRAFKLVAAFVVLLVALHATVAQAQIMGVQKLQDPNNQPSTPQPDTVTLGNGIEFHGGTVMPGPHNIYLIWYGNWNGNTATAILPDFISGLSGSLYFNTNTTYGDNNNNIANTITLAGQIFDNYSIGSALGNTGVGQVITHWLQNGTLPFDTNGIYFVLSSPDVTEGQFCTSYCAYHTHGMLNNTDIKFGFVGDTATQCSGGCSPQAVGPNGNVGADAMANSLAHEINETVTDPDGTGWYHTNFSGEVGDLCNFVFGTTFTALNGAKANMVLGGRQLLIQGNWLNAGGGSCATGYNPQTPAGLSFAPVTPCRVADTRTPNGPFGGPFLSGQTSRGFTIPSSTCGIPATAQAYSINATVVPHGPLGFLTAYPCGQALPLASTLNALDGRIKAGAAIVPAGSGGALCFFATNDTDLVLDINGYFVPNATPSTLLFYPVTPCRLVDTRLPNGPLGGPSLVANAARTFPILSGTCNIPGTAQAYSLNYTSVPQGPFGFLTTWPAGQTQPLVSTLNAPTGVVTANAAIVPAGLSGSVAVFVTNTSDLVIDINGYFAPPATGGLSLYALKPCRVLDTRTAPLPPFNGKIDVNVMLSGCGAPPAAQSYVLNATVVPPGALGFLTLWPQGAVQPVVSTLNAPDGTVTSNMAIVPTTNGLISTFGSNPVHVVLDISGYFAP